MKDWEHQWQLEIYNTLYLKQIINLKRMICLIIIQTQTKIQQNRQNKRNSKKVYAQHVLICAYLDDKLKV